MKHTTTKIVIAFLLIALVAFAGARSYAQCSFWTITPIVGDTVRDSSEYDSTVLFSACDTCHQDGCIKWDITTPLNGLIRFRANDSLPAQVYITTQCSLVIADTCGPIPAWVTVQVNSPSVQIQACGYVGSRLAVEVIAQTSAYPPSVPYLNTVGCTVGIQQQQGKVPRKYAVFDGFLWQLQDKPPANGWYKELE